MTLQDLIGSKTKLTLAGAILSAAFFLMDYTARATLAYADVKSDIRNLATLMNEKQAANERDHQVFQFDIRELRARLDARASDRFIP